MRTTQSSALTSWCCYHTPHPTEQLSCSKGCLCWPPLLNYMVWVALKLAVTQYNWAIKKLTLQEVMEVLLDNEQQASSCNSSISSRNWVTLMSLSLFLMRSSLYNALYWFFWHREWHPCKYWCCVLSLWGRVQGPSLHWCACGILGVLVQDKDNKHNSIH